MEVRAGQGQLQENSAINYRLAGRNDPIQQLQARLNRGEAKLEVSAKQGYLPALLRELKVPVSSQSLVFSKTSLQLHRISPENPRALYFNDDVYVGWIRGAEVLEIAVTDPVYGGVFYTLEQTPREKVRFVRNDDCLQCHASQMTRGVPGFMVRSVYPDETGYSIATLGSHITTQASPMAERWGGWYVTGTSGKQMHAGNVLFTPEVDPLALKNRTGLNLQKVPALADVSTHLSPHSDLVAQLVLTHQAQMHNLLTRISYETRIALQQQAAINEALQRPADDLSEGTQRRIGHAVEEALKYLLFVDEAKLGEPMSGTSDFAKEFASAGKRDARGRSLRDLDLQTRVFRYPCSYLIYSESFDALPPPALKIFYQRLWEVLSRKDTSKAYAALSAADRQAVLEILRATKPTLPTYFAAR